VPDLSGSFLSALRDRYTADKSQALVSIQLLIDNSVGIVEHSDILNELDNGLNSYRMRKKNWML